MTITRFAPSPTGHLHIGGLRTALYNYLYARATRGKFLLRIEDTDIQRNSKEALDGILEAFKWVGLEYDAPTFYQSQRLEIYQKYAKQLLDSNHAYYCYLTKEELEEARQNNKGANHTEFSRKYRDYAGEIPQGIKPSIRIKAPLNGEICFNDGIKGEICFNASEIDDFVILRSDGMPTYNFVVAIDDALSEITDLMRGDDHISNTPKQIIVYQALGFKLPKFYHIPMICNAEGKKLSKRDGALSVLEYRDSGILPQALLNFLFRLGYSDGDKEIFSMQEMLDCFNPTQIHSKASACNFSKLYWLNAEYIKALENEKLKQLLITQESTSNILSSILCPLNTQACNVLLDELKMRVNNLVDFRKEILLLFSHPCLQTHASTQQDSDPKHLDTAPYFDTQTFNKLFTNETKQKLLESLLDFSTILEQSQEITNPQSAKEMIANHAHALDMKPSIFMQSLRLALMGKKGGIDLGAAVFIFGNKESTQRINYFLEYAKTL